MENKEIKSALINMCFEAEAENYNQYWMLGLVNFLRLWDDRNIKNRIKIMKFLRETNPLTQRLYLELMLLKGNNEI